MDTGSGVVLVDKPQGWTSHQVVGRLRRLCGTRKVGHAGTLDPMATGLLIVGVNRATRLLGHLAGEGKTYSATIRLGAVTTTDDAEGEVTSTTSAAGLDLGRVSAGMSALTGDIEQVPSSVSAIKVDGKRAYALARAGEQVELKARPVTVSRFEMVGQQVVGEFLDLDVEVDCSSGTYIRALARDLGADLGVGGHLTRLRRTRIGSFTLPETALDLETGEGLVIVPMGEVARAAFTVADVDEAGARALGYGQRVALDVADEVAALGPDGDLVALVAPDAEPGWARPTTVFAPV